ncbi:MAG TPA: rhodanese-like domain-containing protein [Chloroflexota bacterium]
MGLFSWLFGPTVETVEVSDVRRLMGEGATLIDVREPHEWAQSHVQGAKHVPLRSLERELSKLRTDRQLLFFCRTGSRAARATDMASKRGWDAKNVRGGLVAWTRAGLPLKTGRR